VETIKQAHGGALNKLQKGETANPNGRPRKQFAQLNIYLKTEGFEPLTKSQLIEAYSLLFSVDEATLRELGNDKSQPYALRLIISQLLDSKQAIQILSEMRDYVFGKVKEPKEIAIEQPLFNKVVINLGSGIDPNEIKPIHLI
jgi:hypothetical protein